MLLNKCLKVIVCLSLCTYSCSGILCGDLTGKWKKQLDEADKYAVNFKIRNTPCEFYNIDVVFNTKDIDTNSIRSVHEILYDEKDKIGWQVIRVYDRDNEYLFSHKYTNEVFVQKHD